MRPRKTEHDQETINAFKLNKMLTIVALCALLHFSIATVRRRLKEWGALSSYNHSGRYYTLPSIPEFDKKGLWKHKGVFFSKQGTLKNTVIHLVQISRGGLSNYELEKILGVNPNSYLPQYKQLAGVKREKHNRQVVYFAADEELYRRQKQNRFPPEPAALKLPPDALGIIVLVELVKNPNSTPSELSDRLRRKGCEINTDMIESLFEFHGLKKKLNMSE
jgi:hypothetical protein